MLKRIFSLFLCILLTGLLVLPAAAFTPTGVEIHAAQAIVVNYDTGEVLFDQDADTPVPAAYLTMLMSSLVIAERCDDFDAYTCEMTNAVRKSVLGTGAPVMELLVGGKYSVRELLSLALIGSYCDAVNLAAVSVFGDTGRCVAAMNEKAAALGMTGTVFADVSGISESNRTTARDLSVLFRAAYSVSLLGELLSARRYTLKPNAARENKASKRHTEISFSNTCMIICPITVHFESIAKAGKAGTTDAAGRCVATLCEKGGARYVIVLLGEPNTKEKDKNGNTMRYDFRDTKALGDWAINEFSYTEVLKKGDILPFDVPVKNSAETDRLLAAANETLYATLPKNYDGSTVTYDFHLLQEIFRAPVAVGDELGTVDVKYGDQIIGSVSVTSMTEAPANLFYEIWDAVVSVWDAWFKYVALGVLALIFVFLIVVVGMNTRRQVVRSKKVHKDRY